MDTVEIALQGHPQYSQIMYRVTGQTILVQALPHNPHSPGWATPPVWDSERDFPGEYEGGEIAQWDEAAAELCGRDPESAALALISLLTAGRASNDPEHDGHEQNTHPEGMRVTQPKQEAMKTPLRLTHSVSDLLRRQTVTQGTPSGFVLQRGERIASLRTSLGLTRADLAALLDVSFETVKGWEIGRRAMPEGAWQDLLALRADHDAEIQHRIEVFQASTIQPVLFFETDDMARPLGWQRTVAAAVLREFPDLTIARTTP